MAQERVQKFLDRNAKYAETYTPPPPLSALRERVKANPIGGITILTCSDPRVIPEEFFNFSRLEASVIRTAGGRSLDCMRTLQVLDTVGSIGTVLVIHHTDCGGLNITDDEVRQGMFERNPEEAKKVPTTTAFGTFKNIGLDESIRRDVAAIKSAPFLRKDLLVLGFAYDLNTGLLREVV
ncbi:hypothetical protein OIDMADRAFT_146505 [Oidiodendron maius Zn]|uniref:Carbonic anhydrase n=1 Tax=Oidiodendron maius (strain Zn) TaxID=913774 RepID=A0A0C3DA30_OIDMZ|nr:hypothetical protein OIDMADRAFT_146505 [Oidiodendron maius Zn]